MSEVISVMSPKESGKFIANNSKHVFIKDEGITKLSAEVYKNLKSGNISIAAYGDDGLHPSLRDSNVVDWIFVIDTLNFCFWTAGNATKWKVDGETGYLALCAALRRAVKEGIDISNPKLYSTITEDKLSHIFRSDDGETSIPLLSTRVQCLHEVGSVLLEKYKGTFENCIKDARKSAVSLLKIIVENFSCFRDVAIFEGKGVALYKRAQILVADLWSRFGGNGWGEFTDIEEMAMFADYRVPQVLVHFGALEYSAELLEILKQDTILESGSREEVEIRGCSIQAVELINIAVKKMIASEKDTKLKTSDINSVLIDYFLWMYRREHCSELEYIPFHKVFGKYY